MFGSPTYGMTRKVALGFDDAVERARDALAQQGFGVLSEIDVAATLKKKLGVDRPRYLILGACNPTFAKQALEVDPGIGLLLPCNVVVAEDGDGVVISMIDPEPMFKLIDRPEVAPIAAEVRARLAKALAAV